MSTRQEFRETVEDIENMGGKVVRHELGRHLKIWFERPDGVTRLIVVSQSPRADVRRCRRGDIKRLMRK
jgi:hypothetical protein